MFKDYISNKKAVCFDLDGTLVDSLPLWEEAAKTTFKKVSTIHNPSFKEIYYGVSLTSIYKNLMEVYKVKTEATPEQLATDTKQELLIILDKMEVIEPREGFWELAEELKIQKNFKLALVSNSDHQVVSKFLKKMELLEVFDVVVCGDEVKKRKSDPEMYNVAAKKMGVKPNEMLVFEDSPAGAQAANKAGADMIVIWNADIRESEYPIRVLEFKPDFTGLSGYLDLDYVEYIKKMAEEPDPYVNKKG